MKLTWLVGALFGVVTPDLAGKKATRRRSKRQTGKHRGFYGRGMMVDELDALVELDEIYRESTRRRR